MLLDLLDKTSGEASVLGLDCVRGAREIRQRVGFVAQNEDLYDWMTVEQMIWFCQGFYPTWNKTLTAELQAKLHLPAKTKIRALSRGQQVQLALLLALAYQPELLILDEPTAGLDVVVRRDFIVGIMELLQEEGRTIFFSSHLVHEVERIADWVGILDAGHLIFCGPMEELKAGTRRLTCAFPTLPNTLPVLPGLLSQETFEHEVVFTVRDYTEQTLAMLQTLCPTDIQVESLSLEDIFVAFTGKAQV